jgi:hypothetical protein
MFLALLALAGCAGPRVTDLGGGKHHLAIRSEYGEAADRTHAAQLAEDYCRKAGQSAVIDHFDEQGSFVASPSTGVVFTCK